VAASLLPASFVDASGPPVAPAVPVEPAVPVAPPVPVAPAVPVVPELPVFPATPELGVVLGPEHAPPSTTNESEPMATRRSKDESLMNTSKMGVGGGGPDVVGDVGCGLPKIELVSPECAGRQAF
jgi:hypothetical protein